MPSKTVSSCVSKETCLGICRKSCKILKNSCPIGRLPSGAVQSFLSSQNNQNETAITIFTSDEVQNSDGYGNKVELEGDIVVLQKSTAQADFHQSNERTDTSQSYLMTDNHTATISDGAYGFGFTNSNAGVDSPVNELQFRNSGGCIKRTDGDVGDFSNFLADDGQSRNNDRSDVTIYSDIIAAQDDLLQVDEGALILPIHEEKRDIMSLCYTDLHNEVLNNSEDDPWLGFILQLDATHQECEFEHFFLDSECTAALDSDFFNDLPNLLDWECARWVLSSPTDISSDKPVTLVLDLDETLVHTSATPCDGTDFTFQLDGRILYVQKRPFLHSFLERVSELFRIIIFTAGTRKYADQVLDVLDPERRLTSRRVYRDSCIFSNNGSYKKDLTVLGVDLAKLAILDNTPAVFHELQVNNGIPIKSWIGDPNDQELISLLPFLETLAVSDDVRPFIAEKFKSAESP